MSINSICAAPQCDNPNHDGWLCQSCRDTLRRDLDHVPVVCADLLVTISRQDRLSSTDGRGSEDSPLPLRLGPMEAKRDLVGTLISWACHIAGRRGTPVSEEWIDPDWEHAAEFLASYLSMHLGDVQDDPKAGDIADEIGYAVLTSIRAVDKPLQHQYAGPCDLCGADLYAHPRAVEVACRNCPATYKITARREWLLKQAEDHLLTATEMSRALPGLLQAPLTAAQIRGYAHRGRLNQHPALPSKPREPLYRCGDVIELCDEIRSQEIDRTTPDHMDVVAS